MSSSVPHTHIYTRLQAGTDTHTHTHMKAQIQKRLSKSGLTVNLDNYIEVNESLEENYYIKHLIHNGIQLLLSLSIM